MLKAKILSRPEIKKNKNDENYSACENEKLMRKFRQKPHSAVFIQ